MSLQLRSRSEYEPPGSLRPLTASVLREFKPKTRPFEEFETELDRRTGSPLPILATANDARELVRFFRRRPNGVTVVEAMNSEPRRIFDARKLAAYEFWGLIQREGERLTLTTLGEELADALEPECRLNRSILHSVPAYQAALRSIYEEGLDIATHMDVLRYWSEMHSVSFAERDNPQDMEAAVVCFFSLCHAAELGTSTVGKRGQPARLRVDMEQVAVFLSAEPDLAAAVTARKTAQPRPVRLNRNSQIRRVMVSGAETGLDIDHLDSLLSLAGFESRPVHHTETPNGLLCGEELNEMQQCQAGIFVIGPDECEEDADGTLTLRSEWATRISVAAALFGWRVVIFWNGHPPAPEGLASGTVRLVTGTALDWESSLEVVNGLKELALPLSE